MELRNRQNKCIYIVSTVDDENEGFYIFAEVFKGITKDKTFFMHYRSLAEFCDDWEDVD